MAFDRIEPIGGARGDWQAALVAYITASVNAGKGRQPKLSDFILEWNKPPKGPVGKRLKAGLRSVAPRKKS